MKKAKIYLIASVLFTSLSLMSVVKGNGAGLYFSLLFGLWSLTAFVMFLHSNNEEAHREIELKFLKKLVLKYGK